MPCDLIAERAVISAMVQSELIFHKATEKLTPDHFYHTSHAKIFSELAKRQAGDMFTLERATEKCNDTKISAEDFIGTAYSTRGDTEIKSIVDSYTRRKIILFSQNAINAALSDNESQGVDISSKLIIDASALVSGSGNHIVRLSDLLPAEIERLERICHGNPAGFIETGITDLDNKLVIMQRDYVIVGARPSNGKSTLASLIGRNICKSGGNVLVFYLDSAKEVEVSRAVFTEAGCNLYEFNRGINTKRDFPRLQTGFNAVNAINYYIDDTPSITVEQIAAKAHRMNAETGGLSAVIVDYIQQVHCDQYRTTREKINHISAALHELPRKINCPVVALSQISRYEKEDVVPPSRGNLKESGNLEQDADIILLLHWPGGYPTYSGDDPGFFRVCVAKNKNGPVGTVILNIDSPTMRITNRSNRPEPKDKHPADDWRDDL